MSLAPVDPRLAHDLSFGTPAGYLDFATSPPCCPVVRLPSERAQLSPARLNPERTPGEDDVNYA